MKNKSDFFSIRPAGRHILTIGRDLIQDQYAAIVELIKNAYDADSHEVSVKFEISQERDNIKVSITDNGHGMSRDTIINKWLVPSTDDKLKRRISPKGRVMQGRKGVGRYAASILGDDLLLETVTSTGEKNTVYVEWKNFEQAEYLDDVEVLVETQSTNLPSGTILTITGNDEKVKEWGLNEIQKLKFELKKLISPVATTLSDIADKDSMLIRLTYDDFSGNKKVLQEDKIEPFPIFELFDYQISGYINNDGKGELTFINQKVRNAITENINIDFEAPTECGMLSFDIRVYDREPDAIEKLIKRGLKDEEGHYLGKLQARQLLNEYNGIGVYRNGFRIRPLGDSDFDWLKLNEQRVQNPSLRIGSNQVIGYVEIQPEELSTLEEKSARDGLRDNNAYKKLKQITRKLISDLETRRFEYRQKAGLSRQTIKVERELERLFEFEEMKQGVYKKLTKSGVSEQLANDVIAIISKEEEEKNRIADDIRKIVAIYQGQATLGKIINVILHEGRKPLGFFVNQMPFVVKWAAQWAGSRNPEYIEKLTRVTSHWGMNADIFVKLFKRLDPLAAGKRESKEPFVLKDAIKGATQIFENEMSINNIELEITGSDTLKMNGWYQDIYIIFTNLIDNSIYWMLEKNTSDKKIAINISEQNNQLEYLDYYDNGPGIEPNLIESAVIFEPEFSTKPGGTGLGLAIAGEAATRNGLVLKAFESEIGAYFRLQPSEEK